MVIFWLVVDPYWLVVGYLTMDIVCRSFKVDREYFLVVVGWSMFGLVLVVGN